MKALTELFKHSALSSETSKITSDMQDLVWGEPELAHEYDFDVQNIIAKNRKFEVCNMKECNFLVFLFTLFIGNLVD